MHTDNVPTPFPEWNSLPFPYFFLTWWPTFPTNFTGNCVKSFYLQRIFQNIGYKKTFFKQFGSVCGQISPFVFELSYIFHTLENMKFPTFSWLFDPFPNPFWFCQPIPYVFKALKILNLIPDFFKIFTLPVGTLHTVPQRALNCGPGLGGLNLVYGPNSPTLTA